MVGDLQVCLVPQAHQPVGVVIPVLGDLILVVGLLNHISHIVVYPIQAPVQPVVRLGISSKAS